MPDLRPPTLALIILALPLIGCPAPRPLPPPTPPPAAVTPPAPPADSDGDAIPDDADLCPELAEDLDGVADDDGCPEEDFDTDALADTDDLCPTQPGPPDLAGCPPVDTDGDGLDDDLDSCPAEAGAVEMAGCTTPQAFTLTRGLWRATLRGALPFEIDKARLKPAALETIAQLGATLQQHPEWTLVEIQGHRAAVDDEGRYARRLSHDRAKAVQDALIALHGVDRQRLEARGYGESMPLVMEKSGDQEAPKINRRIALRVVTWRGVQVKPSSQPWPTERDRDGDGLSDAVDVCPDELGEVATKGCGHAASRP